MQISYAPYARPTGRRCRTCSATRSRRPGSIGSASAKIRRTASGCHGTRPGLASFLKALPQANTLVVWRLDRLGRDPKHLVNLAEGLSLRGIGLKVRAGVGARLPPPLPMAGSPLHFCRLAEFEHEFTTGGTGSGASQATA